MLKGLALAALAAVTLPAQGKTVKYYHVDAVGSVRVVTDAAGAIVERHDYLPFGEECTTGGCASNPALGAGEPRKYTGKERDKETGLDYFGARYYGARTGRFTAVDPVYTWNESLLAPQRWNRYAYGRNNPLRYVDPDGRQESPVGIGTERRIIAQELGPDALAQIDAAQHEALGWGFTVLAIAAAGGQGYAAAGMRGAAKEVLKAVVEEVVGAPLPSKGRVGRHFRPDPAAGGRPHTRFRTDADGVTAYETYDHPVTGVGKRVDVVGPPHGGVPTPHVVETRRHTNPKDPSKSRIVESAPRTARPDETPKRGQ